MSRIVVRGDREGLIVVLPEEGESAVALAGLAAHLAQAGAFFKGARVTLETGERPLTIDELRALQSLLADWEVALVALRASHEGTRSAANAIGIELPFVPEPGPAPAEPLPLPDLGYEALLVRRTLRSGQAVRHPGGIIVLGDVNPGAEVIAGGDVLVWGTLRGLVHAGALGDDRAIVGALVLSPTQLRIATHIAVAPESAPAPRRIWQRLNPIGPEVARVQGGAIVVEPWSGDAAKR